MKPENFTTLSKLELEAMAKALPHMSVEEKMELFERVIEEHGSWDTRKGYKAWELIEV